MNFGNLFKIALQALGANKLRGVLTILGIVIGIAAVITMLSIGQGSKKSIQETIGSIGSNMIFIRPGAGTFGGVSQDPSTMETLKMEDFYALQRSAQYLAAISPVASSPGQVVYQGNNASTSIQGGYENYNIIRNYTVDAGTWFTELDVRTAAKVCLIGRTVQNELFVNGEDPVGKLIRFKGIPLRIIGTLTPKGFNTVGVDQDDLIVAPFTTVQQRILAITYLQSIYASVVDPAFTNEALEDVREILRQRHHLKPNDPDDFNVRSMQQILEIMGATTNLMAVLLACIAAISLLVGGIGIMNIMYVSVKERTREIGLRLAIGAPDSAITAQFLIEAVLLSIGGGVIGVAMGIGASLIVKYTLGWPISIQPFTIVLAFFVCTLTGIFFGWYPARSAAKLDPIEALRYE